MPRWSLWVLGAALVGLRIAVVPVVLTDSWPYRSETAVRSDAWRYYDIAAWRGTPYRDFEVEHPPVTLAAIEAIGAGSLRETIRGLMWSQLAVDLGIAVLIGWAWRRRGALAYLVLGVPFAIYPFLYLRLDLLSVALTVGALALLRRRHQLGGGALLAIACFAKLWPLVLVPGLVARRAWRSTAAFAMTAAVGVAAWVAAGG